MAGMLSALVGVAILAAFLNYFYRAERSKRADLYYRTGNELLQKDRVPEAIEQYRNALSISHRVDHRLALGLALIKASRLNEAGIYLNEVLREQPGNGPANQGVATIDEQEGRIDDAIDRYHRAIYGQWPEDPPGNRVRARFALIDLLKKSGRTAQARAELLALVAEAPTDPSLQKQIGRMLIDFGMAREAAGLYRGMLKHGPPDATEYDGLGEAELAQGDYRAALKAFRTALDIDPADAEASRRAELSEKLISLDPSQRGIGSRERFRRAKELLTAVVSNVEACTGTIGGVPTPQQEEVKTAQAMLASKKPPTSFSDSADAGIAAAEKIWSSRPPECVSKTPDDALSRIMSRLAGH
jgi:tetratricopeptide (TPR) repeat protein